MALTTLYKKVRSLAIDDWVDGYDPFEVDNPDDLSFTLTAATVDSTSLKVYQNSILIPSSQYTFDEASSKVVFDFGTGYALSCGDLLEFYYKEYKKYTDNELRQYILSAIIRLSTEKYTTFVLRDDDAIFPTPVESDENLICFIASILMEGNIASYRTNEVSIAFGKDEDNEARIKRAIRQFKKTYGNIDYHNLRRPYTLYVEDSDMTLENLP